MTRGYGVLTLLSRRVLANYFRKFTRSSAMI